MKTNNKNEGVESAEKQLGNLGYKQELKRSLSLPALITYGLIFMVPIAPMSIFGVVFNLSHGMVSLTYLIGFIAMLFTALSYKIMTEEVPTAGSVYAYARTGLGETPGFIAGWLVLLDYLLFPTLAAVFGGVAMHSIVPQVPQLVWVMIYILLSTVANYLGIKWADNVDKILLICQLIIFILFVWFAMAAILHADSNVEVNARPFYVADQFSISFIFSAIAVAALNFLGFDAISTLSEEAKGGGKATGRAIIISLVMVVIFFIVLTTLATWLVPHVQEFAAGNEENEAFFNIAYAVGGTPLKVASAIGVSILAAIGNVVTAQAAVSRILYSMARDGMMPRYLAKINEKTGAPANAILSVAAVTVVLGVIFVGDISNIASLVNVGALSAFALLNLSVIVLFLVKRKENRYITCGLFPLLGLLILVYVLMQASWRAQLLGVIWLVIGVVFLVILRMRGQNLKLNIDDTENDVELNSNGAV